MRSTLVLLSSVILLASASYAPGAPAPAERSVSASHQFVVYGVTIQLRGAVADVAEKTKANVLNLLQLRDNWKIPIVLNLQFPQANVPDLPATALRFSQTGSGLKIQLDLTIAADFHPLTLRRQLLRVILLEMAYRHSPELPAGSYYVEPPDWLIEGLLAADPHQDRAAMINAVSPLVSEDRIIPLDQFLQQKRSQLDTPGELLYRGHALALLQLLLQDTGGPARLSSYIANLSRTSTDPVADLKVFFPILGGAAVDAIWKASVASLKSRRYELLSVFETERRLEELVRTGDAGAVTGGLDLNQFVRRKISKTETAQLRQLRANLMLLTAEANPILRPLVLEYQQIVQRILARKSGGLEKRLANLAARRQTIRGRASEIDDYMNWFEATQSGTTSGSFSGYLRAAAHSNELQSRRRDPLSVYLDALEEQFQ
ncbi:MAG TPA: hypothetical protein VJ719_05260 [Chthoniobacterales bacterium]|nr:hypothetical protein [Chthoniobacterales bacterium]